MQFQYVGLQNVVWNFPDPDPDHFIPALTNFNPCGATALRTELNAEPSPNDECKFSFGTANGKYSVAGQTDS